MFPAETSQNLFSFAVRSAGFTLVLILIICQFRLRLKDTFFFISAIVYMIEFLFLPPYLAFKKNDPLKLSALTVYSSIYQVRVVYQQKRGNKKVRKLTWTLSHYLDLNCYYCKDSI